MFPPEREDKLTQWFEAIVLMSFAVTMVVMCVLVIALALDLIIDILRTA